MSNEESKMDNNKIHDSDLKNSLNKINSIEKSETIKNYIGSNTFIPSESFSDRINDVKEDFNVKEVDKKFNNEDDIKNSMTNGSDIEKTLDILSDLNNLDTSETNLLLNNKEIKNNLLENTQNDLVKNDTRNSKNEFFENSNEKFQEKQFKDLSLHDESTFKDKKSDIFEDHLKINNKTSDSVINNEILKEVDNKKKVSFNQENVFKDLKITDSINSFKETSFDEEETEKKQILNEDSNLNSFDNKLLKDSNMKTQLDINEENLKSNSIIELNNDTEILNDIDLNIKNVSNKEVKFNLNNSELTKEDGNLNSVESKAKKLINKDGDINDQSKLNLKFNNSNDLNDKKLELEDKSNIVEDEEQDLKNDIKSGENISNTEINLVDRKQELEELRDMINRKKKFNKQIEFKLIDELSRSKNIYDGKIFQLDLFEELILYLLEKRDMTEEVFEDKTVEVQDKITSKPETVEDLLVEKKNIFQDRKLFFENLMKFSANRIPINENSERENIGEFLEENKLKTINVYCELNKEESGKMIFFEKEILDENLKNNFSIGLIPIDPYQTSKVCYHNYNLKNRMENLKKELLILTEFFSVETEKIKNDFCSHNEIKNIDYICNKYDLFSLFKENNSYSSTFIKDIIKSGIENKSEFKLERNSSHISNIKLNIKEYLNYSNINLSKYNMSQIKTIEDKIVSLNNKIGSNENNEFDINSNTIILRISEFNSMLDAITLNTDLKIFERSVNMANALLDGFTISELRKTDLKKISNLVKSKVSSYAGRRNKKQDSDREENQLSEVEASNNNDIEEMRKLICELKLDKDESFSILLDDLSSLWKKIIGKNIHLEQYLSMIENIDSWEKSYLNNLNNLKKIQNSIEEFQSLINSNIKKISI